MGKGGGKFKGSEHSSRMNYMYQAAQLLMDVDPSSYQGVANYYSYVANAISKKTQTKSTHHLKRTFCKKCNALLHPGVNCIFRHRSKRAKHVVITCLVCRHKKRFLSADPEYSVWCDKPEAQDPNQKQEKEG